MTLDYAAAARVRRIVWCKDCAHRVEPDATQVAAQYGAATTIPEWRERPFAPSAAGRNVMVVTGTERR